MKKTILQRLVWACFLIITAGQSNATVFNVTDSDFVSEVYELQYNTWTNQLFQNGVDTGQGFANLFLTNSGNTANPAWERVNLDSLWYLQAPGRCGGFGCGTNSTYNTSASATMGWDFSSISGEIATVELIASNFIFQFSPWNDESLGDSIYAEIATPAAFGSGPFNNMYTYTSNNPDGSGPGAIGEWGRDITSFLSTPWLTDPNLLELSFGYNLQDTDIPGKHLQLFRDPSSGTQDIDGFTLRVTLQEPPQEEVPAPATILLFGFGLAGLTLYRRKQQKRKREGIYFP